MALSVNNTMTNPPKQTIVQRYQDPLAKFPLNVLPYSNSVGVVVGYFSPKLGSALWAPAFMYYGADIYDKFKNDKENNFNPSARRGLKQVVFQAMTNLVFPIVASAVGNKVVSNLARLSKDRLPLEIKEHLLKHHNGYISHSNSLQSIIEDVEKYKTFYNDIIEQNIETELRNPKNIKWNLLQKIFKRHSSVKEKFKRNIHKYVNSTIDEIYSNYQLLIQDEKPKQFSKKLFNKFILLKSRYIKEYGNNQSSINFAIQDILLEHQANKLYRMKIAKMLGGLTLIVALTKPINDFVKNTVIKKYVSPGLDKFSQMQFIKDKEKMLRM